MGTLGDKMGTVGDRLTCELCSKTYKERTGLWRHKRKCAAQFIKSTTVNNLATTDDNLATTDDNLATTVDDLSTCENSKAFTCEICNKEYKHRQGLWKHKKKCVKMESLTEYKKEEPNDKNDKLIEYLMKENKEMKELILEIVKNSSIATTSTINTNNNNTITHTNSHNKVFNLQFFLNETCKNAMNITDFVESIKLQLSDFMSLGEVGFVEGLSNIIVKNLNSLDETVRPIHCTDKKRETFYVKDENKWEKEEDDRKKLKKMIKGIAFKNEKLIKTYKETYPDYNNPDSKRSDQYSKIMIEAMDCKEESREKIIRNISKAAIIGKSL